jgi:hypothetical protein
VEEVCRVRASPKPRPCPGIGADVEIPPLPDDFGMIENIGGGLLPDGRGDSTRVFTCECDVNAVVALKRRKHRLQHGDVHCISQIEEDPALSERSPDGPIHTFGGSCQAASQFQTNITGDECRHAFCDLVTAATL